MPAVSAEHHKQGDYFVDYEEKVFEDVKAEPGQKALVTFHTVAFEGSIGTSVESERGHPDPGGECRLPLSPYARSAPFRRTNLVEAIGEAIDVVRESAQPRCASASPGHIRLVHQGRAALPTPLMIRNIRRLLRDYFSCSDRGGGRW